jgi:hypothetical protein
MRPELNEFLCQDHTVSAPIEETLSRMDVLARSLEAKPAVVAAAPAAKPLQAKK